MFEYEEAIEQFANDLQDFIDRYELPDEWFKTPDHIAIKCADGLEYVYTVEDLVPDAQQASEIEMDGRRLAAFNLILSVPIGELGSVSWLEIMEPRPEKIGKDVVGLEHMEFYYPDFDEIKEILDGHKIAFTMQSNSGHSWMNIVINQRGQELKLNDRLLGDTVAEELEDGRSHLLL